MVDYDLFEKILKSEDCRYIENGDFISHKLIELFITSKIEKVKSLFKTFNKGDRSNYDVEVECEECGEIFVASFSKSELFDYLQHLRGNAKHDSKSYYCDDCKKIIKEKELAKSELMKEEWEQLRREATNNYIGIYLNPVRTWKVGVPNWKKIKDLKTFEYDKFTLAQFIKSMDYKEFLQTPYWKAIAERVKYKAKNKCQLCNGTEDLNVHHRSYENHGDELNHMEDLICICQSCHQKHHFE